MVESYIDKLRIWFENKAGTITAFSGGIDSSLVVYLSHYFLGEKAIACISNSASLKQKELQQAIDFCKKYDIDLEVITTDELNDEDYLKNPSNRCYFCKNHLYMSLRVLAERYPGYTLLNGVNTNDLGDYRPGLKAANEHGILSPLVDCGIDKQGVRDIARHLGLQHWNKPASPCLSSRVPYGNAIDRQKLKEIENAEAILNEYGFYDVRVRHFQNEARIEVPAREIDLLHECFPLVAARIKKLGFAQCSIDKEGLVSGKLNRALHG
ncbi:MAG: ATP-dependent sacrificial sulfur transferase LarE [Cyclobacteriaceae bacterium]